MDFSSSPSKETYNFQVEQLQLNYEQRYKKISLETDNPNLDKFIQAIKTNNIPFLHKLLSTCGYIKDSNNLTPLKVAIVNNKYMAVEAILQHLNYIADEDLFALACEYCTDDVGLQIIKELAKCNNFDVNRKGGSINESPLYFLIRNNHKDGIDYLLIFENIDLNSPIKNKQSLLQYAVTNGKLAIVELLASHKNIQLTSENVDTILNSSNNTMIEKVLANNKLDLQNKDKLYEYYFKLVKSVTIKPNTLKYFENYVDINCKDNSGNTVLFYVINNNDYSKLTYFLSHPKIDLTITNSDGSSALLSSIIKNNSDVVKRLFEHVKNYSDEIKKKLSEEVTELNESLLIVSAKNNNYDIFKQVYTTLKYNVNHVDFNGYTALYYAISKLNKNIFQLLINDPEIDVNKQDSNGLSLLMHVCDKKNDEFIYQLLNHKNININLQNHKGHNIFGSILYNKYKNKHTLTQPIVDFNGADTNDGHNYGLFQSKVQHQFTDLIKIPSSDVSTELLLPYSEPYKSTPITIDNNPIKLISTLLKKNIDVNTYDIYNKTPLMYVIDNKDQNIFTLLLNHEGLDLNFKYNDGNTYLMMLFDKLVETECDNTYLTLFLQLLNHSKVNINDTDYLGNTLLSIASGNKDIFVLNHLLKVKNIDLDKQNYKGQMALSNAVKNELWNNVKLLLSYGANQTIKEQLSTEIAYKYNNLINEYKSTNKSDKKGWFS
ncbi:ankyrin repeat protein [Klosneuvirus KNV1]|uniref:Ankyrin repeat protein n=1 Tax=Klosneuvirus KNV1 TaxID=1977640 RepID=A0A1V0SLI2_9VIRU|nr:ankyrin repeat protein [Klosneuvirus KNV1]